MLKNLVHLNLLRLKSYVVLGICLFSCSSCSWRLASSVSGDKERTIAIPYVQGDSTGRLTGDLIAEIEKRTGLLFANSGGDLTLKVQLLDNTYDNIGFRFDPKEMRKDRKKLIASETRQLDLAEVTVVENSTGNVILGPSYILSSIDYDHQNYTMNNDVNVFSLGQLSDIDTTEDAIDIPRYRALAKEIAQYLENNFDKLKYKEVINN